MAKLALPAGPTGPMSRSNHPEGSAAERMVTPTEVLLVKLPETPVTMRVNGPVTAVMVALSVSVLLPVVLLGLNVAVTPLGKPDADKLTLPVKPLRGVTVIALVPLAPWKKLRLLGDAESVKLPLLFRVSEIVVVLVKNPDVPVIVTLVTPVVAVPLAVNVKVLVLVALAGLNVAVTPVGSPDADKLTLLLKPFTGVIVIVLVPLLLCAIVRLLGDAESEKPGMGPPVGQFATKLVAFNEPMPVAKSQPVVVPYARL